MSRDWHPLRRPTLRLGAALLVGAGLAGAGLTGAALPDGLSPGEWKLTETITMNGSKTPPQERTRCMTPAQVGDLEKTFSPEYRTVNSGCERTEFTLTPTALRWRMQCTGQMNMDVAGDFAFDNPEHYTATIRSKGEIGGRQVVETSVGIEAERTGDCR